MTPLVFKWQYKSCVTLTSCRRGAGDGVTGGADDACQFAVPPGCSEPPWPLWGRAATLGWGRGGMWRGGGWPNTEAQPGAAWPAGRGRGRRRSQRADGWSSTRGGHRGGGARLRRRGESDGESELPAHHSCFNEGVCWCFRRLLW